MMARMALRVSLFLIAGMAFFFHPFALPGSAEGATKVRFAENWVLGGEHIPEFIAQEKGFFAAEGIETEIARGFGAVDTFRRVAAGDLDIGSSVLVSVALGRASGAKVKIVKITMHTSPYGLAFMKGAGINRPKDLEGKKVAIPASSSVLQFWPAFAKLTGIDRTKVGMVNLRPAILGASLASGIVDAVDSWLTSLPAKEETAREMGKEIGFFLWSDYGLKDMYGALFVAREDTIAKRPGMLRKFITATLRGHAYTLTHPEEGVDVFMKRNPGRNRAQMAKQWAYMARLSSDEHFKKDGLGRANPGKMEKAMESIRTYLGLKNPVATQDTYTNAFVERVPREYRFPKLP